MERFISAVKQSLENKNWYAALYLCLTLPDICARLESENGKTNRSKFVAWYDRYMADKYRHQMGPEKELHVFLSGNDFYALRCAMLHEGGSDITTQQCQEALQRLHFTVVGAHCNQFNNVLQLDVPHLCNDVCDSVKLWFKEFMNNHNDKAYRIDELVKINVGPHSMGGGVHFG